MSGRAERAWWQGRRVEWQGKSFLMNEKFPYYSRFSRFLISFCLSLFAGCCRSGRWSMKQLAKLKTLKLSSSLETLNHILLHVFQQLHLRLHFEKKKVVSLLSKITFKLVEYEKYIIKFLLCRSSLEPRMLQNSFRQISFFYPQQPHASLMEINLQANATS